MNARTDLSNAYVSGDIQKIQTVYIDLLNLRCKLDRWFNKYLDMFNDKLTASDRNDPIWKLYRAKSGEYSDINHMIKIAEYYLNKK